MKHMIAVMLLTLVSNVSAQQPPQPPQWGLCSACHGLQGQGGIGPTLQGQTAEYISDMLKAYRANETVGEQSPMMWPNAASLTDADIKALAEYIQSIPAES